MFRYNVPNATENPYPIIQYFFAAVTYNESLPPEYFTLPPACLSAVEFCEKIPDSTVYTSETDSNDCNSNSISVASAAGIAVSTFVAGLAGAFAVILFRHKHMKKTFSAGSLAKAVENSTGDRNPMITNSGHV